MTQPTQTPDPSRPTLNPRPSADDPEHQTAILWARQAAIYGAEQTDLAQIQSQIQNRDQHSEATQSQDPPTAAPTHLSRPETLATITQMAMNSQTVTRNLKSKSYPAAIVAAHLAASRLRNEVDQWHSGAGPRPWNWQVRTSSLREQSDPLNPHLRVIHTHTTISPDAQTLKLSAPAWLCENCNNMSICQRCPCFHWSEPDQDSQHSNPRTQPKDTSPNPNAPAPDTQPQDQTPNLLEPQEWDTLLDFITEYDSYNHLAERKCLDARDIRLIAQQYKVLESQVKGVFTWCVRNNRLPDHPQTTQTPTHPAPKP